MTESIQKKLLRVRPPRVKITYDVETGGAIEKRELPFIVGILADLYGYRGKDKVIPQLRERKMTDIDRDNFNDVMKTIEPSVDLSKLPDEVKPLLPTPDDKQVVFHTLDDFEPMQVIRKLPSLNALYESRGQIRSLQSKAEADDDYAQALAELTISPDPKVQADLFASIAGLCKVGGEDGKDNPDFNATRKDLIALYAVLSKSKPTDDKVKEILKGWTVSMAAADANDAEKAADFEAQKKVGHGFAYALQEADTPENRVLAKSVIETLELKKKDKGDKEPSLSQRDGYLKRLGIDVPAEATDAAELPLGVTSAGLDYKAEVGDAKWADALLLLGLVNFDADAGVEKDPVRAAYLAFANRYKASSDDVKKAIIQNVIPLIRDDFARIVLWLKQFSDRVANYLADANNGKDMVATLGKAQKRGPAAVIDEMVAHVDRKLSKALTAILHCQGFKDMEATWRGLAYLVFNTETSTMLKLRVFNAQKDELTKDMNKAVEFDQSVLFKLVYEAEYGTYGGFPYSLLVGGYEIGSKGGDIDFLKKMSEVAAAAHAPFIAATSNEMFGLSGFDKLDKPRDLAKIFENADLTAWREFRETEDARYVSLVMPRALLRLPYGRPDKRNTTPCEGVNFEENVAAEGDQAILFAKNGDVRGYPRPDNKNFLWGNAAYLLAERITHAFSLYSWTAAIRGVEGGGLVEGLPLYTYTTDAGGTELFCPIEVSITDRREKELNDLGFISLCHCKGTGKAAFFGGQTTNRPKKYFSDDANANAKISAMLPYILAASRFAHYIKVMMRDKVGSFLTRGNVEAFLNTWIANYVLLDDNASQEVKSAFPLRQASVVVTDVPGQPGSYSATVFLKPHFQLEELTTSIRLVAKIPG